MKIRFGVLALLLAPICAYAIEDEYMCVAEQSTGFRFNESTLNWESAKFDVAGSKYVVKRRFADDRRGAFGIYLLGGSEPFLLCDVDDGNRSLDCEDFSFSYLRFQYETLRFIKYFEGQYAHPVGSLEPYIEIGKCTPIEVQ